MKVENSGFCVKNGRARHALPSHTHPYPPPSGAELEAEAGAELEIFGAPAREYHFYTLKYESSAGNFVPLKIFSNLI